MNFETARHSQLEKRLASHLLYDLRDADEEDRLNRSDETDRIYANNGRGSVVRYIDSPVTRVEKIVMEAMDGRGSYSEFSQFPFVHRLGIILDAARQENQFAGTGNASPPFFSALETLCVLVRYALPSAVLEKQERKDLEHQLNLSHGVIDQQLRKRVGQSDDLYPRINYNSFLLTNVSPQLALHASSLNAYRMDFQDYTDINVQALRKICEEGGKESLITQMTTPLQPLWYEATKIHHHCAAMDVLMEVHDSLSKCAEELDEGMWFYTNLMTAIEMPEGNALTEKAWDKVVKLYESCIDQGRTRMASGILDDVMKQIVDAKDMADSSVAKNKKIEATINHCLSYAECHEQDSKASPQRPLSGSGVISSSLRNISPIQSVMRPSSLQVA